MPDWMAVEALNVTLYNGDLGVKRSGFVTVSLTGDNYGSFIVAATRFVAAQDETAA
jgi:hypothetical protein